MCASSPRNGRWTQGATCRLVRLKSQLEKTALIAGIRGLESADIDQQRNDIACRAATPGVLRVSGQKKLKSAVALAVGVVCGQPISGATSQKQGFLQGIPRVETVNLIAYSLESPA